MDIANDSVIPKDGQSIDRIESFRPLKPMPGVVPGLAMDAEMAMDDFTSSAINWAGIDALDEGLSFMGYPYLAQLTQRPEYRRPSEILAKEMTRKWIRIQAAGDEDKSEKVKQIEDELKRLNAQDVFQKAAEFDGFFGRSQIFIDVGQTDPGELALPLHVSKRKIIRGSLRGLKVIEPMWTYPDAYNSNNPLADDFYKPTSWFVFAQRIHASRLMTLVSRDVPDILKPNYGFGGLSLSQMAKPYIDNWLRTRQSVSDAVHNYSVSVLMTNMSGILNKGGAAQMVLRARLFNQARDNQGLMMVDKETEDFKNVSTPLGGLDHLQSQSQEQMSAVTGIPLVILLGITPTGLNASSEGELDAFYAWVEAQQRTLFGPPLKKLLEIIQLSLFGEIDPSITFMFEPLQVLSETEQATVEKTKMDTDVAAIGAGIIDPLEARTRLANDEDGPYASLDLSKQIAPPTGEQGGEGGDPFGGGEEDPEDPNDPSGGGAPGGGQPDPNATPKPTPGAVKPAAAPTDKAPLAHDSRADGTPMDAAGIMFRAADGTVLLLKRGEGGDHAGQWCFPGGKVEDGETFAQAAQREADEEIGEQPPAQRPLIQIDEETSGSGSGVHFVTFSQMVDKPFVPKLNAEHVSWAWAQPEALPEPMHPGPLATIKRARGMAADAGWIEEDHERAPNGQFGAGSGGASGGVKPPVHNETATVTAKASAARAFVPAALYEEAQRTIALYAKEESPTAPLTDAEKAKATDELATHLAAAHEAKPDYDSKMKAIAEKIGAKVKLAGIKGGDRLLEKHVRENGSNPLNMRDLVRGSLIVNSLDEVGPALDAVRANFKLAPDRLKDRFAKPMPSGYSDLMVNVELPGGIQGEVQIHIPEMIATKSELGHALYDIERKLPPGSALKSQLIELQGRIYGAARSQANQVAAGKRPTPVDSHSEKSDDDSKSPSKPALDSLGYGRDSRLPDGPASKATQDPSGNLATGMPSTSRNSAPSGKSVSFMEGAPDTPILTFDAIHAE